MIKFSKLNQNQKAPANSQDFLTRRPVELNHILFNRTIRLSGDDQNRLVSTSHNLRNFDYNIEIKNNLSVVEEVVFGPIFSDVTSPDNCLHYNKPRKVVKGPTWANMYNHLKIVKLIIE